MIKTTTVGIRLNEKERERIAMKAIKHNLTMGKYLKTIATEKPMRIVKVVDPVLLNQLTRIGVNINQIAHAMNSKLIEDSIDSIVLDFIAESLGAVRNKLNELGNKLGGK